MTITRGVTNRGSVNSITEIEIIDSATAVTYISGTGVGTGVGQVNPVDWIIETVTSGAVTKVTINGGFDHFQEDGDVIITFPDGTFSGVISMMATRDDSGSSSPVNFSGRTGNSNVYTINRNNTIDGDHGLSFCIIGTR